MDMPDVESLEDPEKILAMVMIPSCLLLTISNLLGIATCKILGPSKHADIDDFMRMLQESLVMSEKPTILQINTESHTDDGNSVFDTWYQPRLLAEIITIWTETYKPNLKGNRSQSTRCQTPRIRSEHNRPNSDLLLTG